MGQATSLQAPLEVVLGYKFRNPSHLLEALTHDSLSTQDQKNYQRLEFLGDAVIHFVITNYLYQTRPKANEGDMSLMRADLVNHKEQKKIAKRLEIEKYVQLHPGVRGFAKFDKFLESIIGAVFIDAGGGDGRGYQEAKTVIYNLWSLN